MIWRALALVAGLLYLAISWAMPSSAPGPYLFLWISATVGMFHGALDVWLIRVLPNGAIAEAPDWKWLAGYGSTTLFLIVLFAAMPIWVIPVLLAVTVIHFGYGVVRPKTNSVNGWRDVCEWLSVGAAPIAAPALLKHLELAQVLTKLSPEMESGALASWWIVTAVWAIASVALLLWWLWQLPLFGHRRILRPSIRWVDSLSEIMSVFSLNLFLDPISAFALYFGLIHCPRHIAAIHQLWLQQQDHLPLRKCRPFWIGGAWLIPVLVAWILVPSDGFHLPWLWVEAALLVITAVTVPHTLLVGKRPAIPY